MRTLSRLVASLIALLALAGSIAEGAGAHGHAIEERDLVAHSVVVSDRPGECAPATHFDHAVRREHPVCPGCAFASSPGSAAAPATRIAVTADQGIRGDFGSRPPSSAPLRSSGPPRAPPAA